MTRFTPIEYLKIDIGNMYGHDKKSFQQRIAWVDKTMANRPDGLRNEVTNAERPAQYLAAVIALEDALAGRPTGHLVGLDACASGITILGILSGCHTTCSNTGTIGQKRMDMYGECNKAMNALLESGIETARNDVKESQMTWFYGSKATPKRIFGEDTNELWAFYQAQESVAPGACYIMRELLDSWQPYATEHRHTLPDGFHAIVPVLQKFKSKIEIDELDHATVSYIYEDIAGSETGLAVAAKSYWPYAQ